MFVKRQAGAHISDTQSVTLIREPAMSLISLPSTAHPSLGRPFAAFGELLGTWRQRARLRRELATLDFRTLRDIGVSAGEIQFEANKPFWRA